jgi:hypothetical protein
MEPLQQPTNATTRNQHSYTLGTAAKATGKNKSTIHRAIKSGKISATRDDSGTYHIDPAELHRVFPPETGNGSETQAMPQDATHSNAAVLQHELEILREERERERRQLQDVISDLQKDRDHWRQQATYLLALKQSRIPEPPQSWLGRLLRRKP